MLEKILGSVSFVVAVFAGALVVAYKLPRRKHYVPGAILLCIGLCAFRYGVDELIAYVREMMDLSYGIYTFLRSTNCLLVMLLCSVSVLILHRSGGWMALFCGSVGYCMQFIGRKLYDFFTLLFEMSPDKVMETGLVFAVSAAVYFLIWLTGIRRLRENDINDGNKGLVVCVILVAAVTIYVNSYATYTWELRNMRLYLAVLSILAAAITLVMELLFFQKKAVEKEAGLLKQMLHQEREQYRVEKTVIDTINIKSHDLKHQLMALDGRIPSEELSRLEQAVEVYDSVFKTDNNALNVVLTTKNLICESKGIVLTCIADGEVMSFMKDTDIYSFFGNILDNAIEAAEKVADEEKRLISMTIQKQQGYAAIHETNYFAVKPVIVNGLPQTTKKNDKYHGFGIPSIRLLVEKYRGEMQISMKEDVYCMDIVFPLEDAG